MYGMFKYGVEKKIQIMYTRYLENVITTCCIEYFDNLHIKNRFYLNFKYMVVECIPLYIQY